MMDSVGQHQAYISVDVETAGPIPGDYSLLAIGACLVANPEETFYAELQPISTKSVPAALAVTGFSLEQLAMSGRPPLGAMVAFAAWVQSVAGTATPVFVGFNAGFDWAFVNWYFHHFMGDNPFGISALDIKSYFMGLAGVAWSDTRSSKLPKRYQDANTGGHSHNAFDDAVKQASIFARMLADARTS